MLSVCNVATLLGGTARCGLDCVRALPEWDHMVLFLGKPFKGHRPVLERTFGPGIHLRFGPGRVRELVQKWTPDLVLFHNTSIGQIPAKFAGHQPLRVYYQHSRHVPNNDRFDIHLMVSNGLADACGFGKPHVIHQPVSVPEWENTRDLKGGPLRIGKICTPTKSKWLADSVGFYSRLAERFPEAIFEFVGTPPWVSDGLLAKFPAERFVFHPARVETQSVLYRWHVMLHDGPWESYGRTICEAQQCGCIPITRGHGGTTEQIEHGKTGFLISRGGGTDEWIQAIQRVEDWLFPNPGMFLVNSSLAQFAGRARGGLESWALKFKEKIGVEF